MTSKTSPTRSKRTMTTCHSKWLVFLATGVLTTPGAVNAQTLSTSVDSVAVRPDSTPGRGARVHVVQRGETLRGLASSYLGDVGRWREILQRNRSVVRDAAHLEPGTRLVLPTRAPERTTLRMADGVALFPLSAMDDDRFARFRGRTIFFGETHTGSGPKFELRDATASRYADTLRAGSFGLRRTSTTLALPVSTSSPGPFPQRSSRSRMPSLSQRIAAPWLDAFGGPLSAGRILSRIDAPAVVASEGVSDLHLYDKVRIAPPTGAPALVGTRYLAFRLGRSISGHGQVVIPVGIVRVDRIGHGDPGISDRGSSDPGSGFRGDGDHRTEASLVAKFSSVAQGAGLLPLATDDAADSASTSPFLLPSSSSAFSLASSRAPSTLHTHSQVLAVMSDAALPTVQDIVLIGAGSTQGVRPGDRVTLFADEAARDRSNPADHGIATAVVLRVSDRGASAVIVRQAQPAIRVGTPVRVTFSRP